MLMTSILILSVIYAERHNLVNYAMCHYAECRYAECRSTLKTAHIPVEARLGHSILIVL
jgi:hypothetical protein